MIIAMLLTILMFTSTSTASFLFSEGIFYDRLPENSPFKTMLDRFYQVAYNNDDDVALDADEEDDETDDEDDGEYDDEIDSDDGPEEDVLLPKIWDIVGEITPYKGNYVDVDDSEETTTIDLDGEVGATQDEVTVDSDGDEGEWTVDHDGEGETLERFVKIVTELNVKLEAMLERVIKRTVATDENGISSRYSSGISRKNLDINPISYSAPMRLL